MEQFSVCDWNSDYLEWSRDMVKNSVSFKLWREIGGLLPETTGPEIFKAAVKHLQRTSTKQLRP